jgi:hypothetical protein
MEASPFGVSLQRGHAQAALRAVPALVRSAYDAPVHPLQHQTHPAARQQQRCMQERLFTHQFGGTLNTWRSSDDGPAVTARSLVRF